MRLSDLSIKNPVMAWMIMFFLIIFGAISFSRMGISQYPDIDLPNVNVTIPLSGASPEVIESTVIQIVEDSLTTVEGVKTMSSSSRTGVGQVNLEFDINRNIESAIQDVQTKMSQISRRLPKDVDQISVSKVNPEDQPIMYIAISAKDKTRRELMKFAKETIRDQLTSLPGVGEISYNGFIDPILKIQVIPEKLKKYNMTVLDVIDSIQSEHNELPAGQVESTTTVYNIRLKGELKTANEFKDIIISKRSGQINQDLTNKVRLKDVADVQLDLADMKRMSRFNGETSVSLGIKKQRGTNAVEVSKEIKSKISQLEKAMPEGFKIQIGFDSTRFIAESINELNKHLLMAVLLTALVCWIFLGSWGATFNVLLSIPTSILGTFIVLYFFKYTLNIFTLLGLTLSIGIVVDDAIMVLENIFRNNEIYKNKFQSSIIGAREVTFSAIAATAAVVAIFLPVAFINGIIGKFFLQFGITISVAVIFSLFEALTITPMRSAYFNQTTERTSRLGQWFETGFLKVLKVYTRFLSIVVKAPWKTVFITGVFAFLSFFMIKFINKELTPQQESGLSMASIQLPIGTPFSVTEKKLQVVEFWLKTEKPIERFSVGIDSDPNRMRLILSLKPKKESGISQTQYHDLLRKKLKELTKGKVNVFDMGSRGMGGGGGKGLPIEFILKGPDWDILVKQSEAVLKLMDDSGYFVDTDSNLSDGLPEIQAIPKREKTGEMGVSVAQIAKTMNVMMAGYTAVSFSEDSHRYDAVVSLKKSNDEMFDLKNIYISNLKGNLIPVSNLVTFEERKTSQQINHLNRERAVSLSANLPKGQSVENAWKYINDKIKPQLQANYYIDEYGSSADEKETFKNLILALILGLILAYMILAAQFNSFIDPISVLVVLPFSLSGVFLGLLITGQTINMYSMIGVLLLMGIVKKNSILLVDFANKSLFDEKLTPVEAMLEAAQHRLRPILMTSFATIVGAIPTAMATGPGSELTKSMAITIIFGSFVATFFTLFIVPAVYILLHRFRKNKEFSDEVKKAFIQVADRGLN